MGLVYGAILVLIVAFVLTYGERDERIWTITLVLVSLGTAFVVAVQGVAFADFNVLLIANEAILLVVSLSMAYRSKRFWPLPVASLELAAFFSLLAPLFGRNLVSYAMGVGQGMWAYPQLIILALAVLRQRNRGRWNPWHSC